MSAELSFNSFSTNSRIALISSTESLKPGINGTRTFIARPDSKSSRSSSCRSRPSRIGDAPPPEEWPRVRVENAAQARFLVAQGCVEAQGFQRLGGERFRGDGFVEDRRFDAEASRLGLAVERGAEPALHIFDMYQPGGPEIAARDACSRLLDHRIAAIGEGQAIELPRSARGVGNGISLIIMAGIVANLPNSMASLLELGRTGALSPFFILLFFVLAIIGAATDSSEPGLSP